MSGTVRKGCRLMHNKKDLLDSLEVINENLNTLIHNQMIIYGEIKKILESQGVEEKNDKFIIH